LLSSKLFIQEVGNAALRDLRPQAKVKERLATIHQFIITSHDGGGWVRKPDKATNLLQNSVNKALGLGEEKKANSRKEYKKSNSRAANWQ